MPYYLLLVGIEIILFIRNYVADTYLIGWDNLMPELNLWLNLKRSLFSVWQEYRGLGLLDGMSHASNLLHTLYIAFLNLFFPNNMLRYAYIFLTHLLGGIGLYYLGKKLFKDKNAAFGGALFYMLNLGVIQIYSAPLEVFATHFAALPFLVLTTINVLGKPNKKNVLLLFLASILTSPQTFVPTIFIAFFILFFFILFFHYLQHKNFKSVFIAFSVVIISNSFWLLPFAYSAKNNAKIIENTRINQFSSEEIYLKNKAFGDLVNVLTLKGFMMDAQELDNKTNKNEYLMTVWRDYTKKPIFNLIFLMFTIIMLLGAIKTIKDKNFQLLPFLLTLLTAFFFLANNMPVLEQLNNIFRTVFPTLGEVFRFPFTKFIILFAFCYSVFFTFGVICLFQKAERYKNIILLILFLSIGYTSLPAFQGYFISPFMKQKIPDEYFKIMNYFNSIDHSKRVAFLPTPSFWNWEHRNWGQRGSGFLWYGIPQPIMLRAFDLWSQYNEQFYNEFNYAQKKDSIELFNQVLSKYNIDFLLLDTSLINILSPKPINYDKIKEFLDKNPLLVKDYQSKILSVYKVKQQTHKYFVSFIKNPVSHSPVVLYNYSDPIYGRFGDYINDNKNPEVITVLPSFFTEKLQKDLEFNTQLENDKITFTAKKNPFRNLQREEKYNLTIPSIINTYLIPAAIVNENGQTVIKIIQSSVVIDNVEYKPADINIALTPQIIGSPVSFKLTESNQIFRLGDSFYLLKDYPSTMEMTDNTGNSELTTVNLSEMDNAPAQITVAVKPNSTVEVNVPIIKSVFTYENLISKGDYSVLGNKNEVIKSNGVTLNTSKDKKEVVIYKDNLPHQNGYIFFVNASWKTGLPLSFYIDNPFSKRAEMETKIAKATDFTNILVLPPTENIYSGYGLHFVANPLGKDRMETSIHNVSIYPLPYEVLKEISLEKTKIKTTQLVKITSGFTVNKTQTFLYEVNLKNLKQNQNSWYLKLSQAYHDGWLAYVRQRDNWFNKYMPFIFGKRLNDHVLLSNWANGWVIDEKTCQAKSQGCRIQIIFWPQYLQFLGFGLMILALIYVGFFYEKKHERRH